MLGGVGGNFQPNALAVSAGGKDALHASEQVGGQVVAERMGRSLLKRLKIYAGPNHPHGSNHPEPLA